MLKAYGLYSHIRANKLRTAYLLAGFIALLVALMFSVALLIEGFSDVRGAPFEALVALAVEDVKRGWPMAVAGAGVWFVIAYFFHQKMIDFATGASALSRAEAPRLYNLLENLCISRGIPIPALQVIEDEALNAYASGIREGHYNVAVTRGLIEALTDAELEAVLAHELTHIRNRDVQLMVVAVIFAGIFAFAGDLIIRNWNFPFGFSPHRPSTREDERRGGDGAGLAIIVALAIIVLSWGASVLIRFAISRSREYLADAGAVELTKNPDAMISALRKISARAAIPSMPSRMHGFFIESPALTPDSLLSSHPSVEDRIAALVEYAGGIDAPPQAHGEAGFLPQDGRNPLDSSEHGPWG